MSHKPAGCVIGAAGDQSAGGDLPRVAVRVAGILPGAQLRGPLADAPLDDGAGAGCTFQGVEALDQLEVQLGGYLICGDDPAAVDNAAGGLESHLGEELLQLGFVVAVNDVVGPVVDAEAVAQAFTVPNDKRRASVGGTDGPQGPMSVSDRPSDRPRGDGRGKRWSLTVSRRQSSTAAGVSWVLPAHRWFSTRLKRREATTGGRGLSTGLWVVFETCPEQRLTWS